MNTATKKTCTLSSVYESPSTGFFRLHLVKRLFTSVALPAVCGFALSSVSPAAPTILYYGSGSSATSLNTNGTVRWSTSPSGSAPLSDWTNGDYAYFTVTGVTAPGNITVQTGTGVDTAGMTINPSTKTTPLFHSSTLGLDADPSNTNGVYATFESDNTAAGGGTANSGFNFGSVTLADGPLTNPVPTGLFLSTQTEGGTTPYFSANCECFSSTVSNKYSGGTWVGAGVQYVIEGQFGLPATGTLTLGNGGSNAMNTCFRSFWGSGTPKPTLVIPNPVVVGGNLLLDNGATDNPLTFTGPMTLSQYGCWMSCNANTISFNGSMSGPGGVWLTEGNGSGAGWGSISFNAPNSYTGGTIIGYNFSVPNSPVFANASNSLPGNVTCYLGTSQVLWLQNSAAMASTGVLDLENTPSGGQIELNFTGTNTISGLIYDGVQLPLGVYGSDPTLPNTNPNGVFAGPGYLNVLPAIRITSQTVSGGNVTLCWSSSNQSGNATYNVMETPTLGVGATWTTVNTSPIQTQGTTTCYTFPQSGQQEYYVVQQPNPQQ